MAPRGGGWRMAAGAALLACTVAASGEAKPLDVVGRWETNGGTSHIDIRPCGEGRRCGRIVWMRNPSNAEGRPKRDRNNAEASMRERPLLGLELLSDFVADEESDEWSGGTIYNPRDGQRYRAVLKRRGENELVVRGFVGNRLFGKSRIWRRVHEAEPDGARAISPDD